jgi:hypothetical protein
MIEFSLYESAVPRETWEQLTPDEMDFLMILTEYRGRENAIDGNALALRAGIEDRDPRRIVRKVVSKLRRDHGVAICSNSMEPSGYYLAATADELDDAAASLIGRGLKILSAAARMKKKTLAEFMGQLKLEDWTE